MDENDTTSRTPEKQESQHQEDTSKPQESKETEEQPSYHVHILLGLLGGSILTILHATGRAEGLRTAILFFMQATGGAETLRTTIGNVLLVILHLLVVGGGITVIAGTLLLESKLRFLGIRLISIGAGISLIDLILRIITFGPQIQGSYLQFLSQREFHFLYSALSLLGSGFGLLGVGVILAFLATFKELKWPTIIAGISFTAMLSGLGADPASRQVISYVMAVFHAPSSQLLFEVFGVFGAIILIVAVIYGLGWELFAKIMLVIASFLAIASIGAILMCLPDLIRTFGSTSYIVLICLFRILGMITVIAASIMVIQRG